MKIDVNTLRAMAENTAVSVLESGALENASSRPCFLFFEPGGQWASRRKELNDQFPDDAAMMAVVSEDTAKAFLGKFLPKAQFQKADTGYQVFCFYSDETHMHADQCVIDLPPRVIN